MPGRDFAEQPLVGFNYDYWFACVGCGGRVKIPADEYERQSTMQAPYTQCDCSTEVDITEERPTLRNPNDPVLQNDLVDQLYWYHSSRYEHWPDIDAYAADVTEAADGANRIGLDPESIIQRKCGLALHLGTYEAAIENMFRRLHDQDVGDPSTNCYWLHRVRLKLKPGDLDPSVGGEFITMFGDVELADLYSRGGRASRYINLHEAIGSISLAVDPAAIHKVATIAIPTELTAAPETDPAAAAVADAVAALARNEETRPDTDSFEPHKLRLATLTLRSRNPEDADDALLRIAAQEQREYEDRYRAIWAALIDTLTVEYLAEVNEQVRQALYDAVSRSDPETYHREFRMMAGLLIRPAEIIDRFESVPERTLSV